MTSWLVAAVLLAQAAQEPRPTQPPPGASPLSDELLVVDGHVSLVVDALPKRHATELRPQLVLDARGRLGSETFRYRVEAIFEGLIARRDGRATDVIARVRDAWFQAAGEHGDVRAGYGRIVWGRLDEIQPSDVINPLDAARFLFDGRSEARLPVAFIRGRLFVRDGLTIEGVMAPFFRRGRFDELDEATSPFNLLREVVVPAGLAAAPSGAAPRALEIERVEPRRAWSNVSRGGRVSATLGRVDVAAAVYRGFEGFGLVSFESGVAPGPAPAILGRLVERYPRFTMISGDFETVKGDWALRGEAAAFVDKQFRAVARPGIVKGRALDAGVGFERRSGNYRVFGSGLVHREWSAEDPAVNKTDLSVVASIERQLDRDRALVRVFVVVNPADESGFVRGLFVWKVRDDVALEGSAGAFLGTSDDTLGRFRERDFLFARVRYHF